MKKSAVKWLFQQLWDKPKDKFTWYALREQATQMEVSFITEIDHRLSVIEDYAKGEAGDEITKLRKYISENYGK